MPTVVKLQLNCNCDHSNKGLSDITLGQQTGNNYMAKVFFFCSEDHDILAGVCGGGGALGHGPPPQESKFYIRYRTESEKSP